MSNINKNFDEFDFNLDFLIDDEVNLNNNFKEVYKILIADDDKEIHSATKLILRDFTFEGKRLQFIEAYSGQEVIDIMKKHSDIALILLDVVMDENDDGLKVVDYIRNILENKFVRIIIRTGQPGEAPEEKVIVNYDINDYLVKTEATVQRLFTSLYQSLRAYRDIIYIDNNRKGLEKIIKSSSKIFIQGSVQEFFNCILNELMLFRNDNSSVCFRGKESRGGIIYLDRGAYGEIIAATGVYEKYLGKEINEIDELQDIYDYICKLENVNSMDLIEICGGFLVWIKSNNNNIAFIFIKNEINDYDIELIKIFLLNYSLALDSYIANQQSLKAQVEIINTLGDAIEKRSHETANHVLRVSEICYIMAKKMGLPEETCDVLKVASTMHDVGKIGILDNILMKPGKLTEEEFEIIKTHTEIGHKIFYNSGLDVLRRAADICLNHHEKYDGTGYPNGLKGDEIPLDARIVSVVDVFDALTHKRCYKSAWTVEEANEYIKSQSGMQFDPKIVDIFIEIMNHILNIRDVYPD